MQSSFEHIRYVAFALANHKALGAVLGEKYTQKALQKLSKKSLLADEKSAVENEQKILLCSLANIADPAQHLKVPIKAFDAISCSIVALAYGCCSMANNNITICTMAFD